MARKGQKGDRGRDGDVRESFAGQVRQALRHFTDPGWLGEHSPLAQPYFLGDVLRSSGDPGVLPRGRVLQQLLLEAAVAIEDSLAVDAVRGSLRGWSLWREHKLYADRLKERLRTGSEVQRLLHWSFFAPPGSEVTNLARYLEPILGIERATVFRRMNDAVAQLSRSLIRRVQPALRLEPVTSDVELVGREALLKECEAALANHGAVAIEGPAGIGKTALGRVLATQHPERPVFWYTIRLGLNDNLDSLLFRLGYFLHVLYAAHQSTSTAWQQLVADQGQVNRAVVASLVQHDLDHVPGSRPLLCFDDLDRLRPLELLHHAPVCAFLEQLAASSSLLVIGEMVPLKGLPRQLVPRLADPDLKVMLERARVALPDEQRARLVALADGYPRTLELLLALYRAQPTSSDAWLEGLKDQQNPQRTGLPTPTLLLGQLWRQLGIDEQAALMQLSIFTRPVPRVSLEQQLNEQAIDQLLRYRLVQQDSQGSIVLMPTLRGFVANELTGEEHDAAHLMAARVWAMIADTTSAMAHLVRGGMAAEALDLWRLYRDEEIGQGRGATALDLLRRISGRQLDPSHRKALAVERGSLALLVGENSMVERALRAEQWPSPSVMAALARRVAGGLAELRGDYAEALAAYEQGLGTIEHLAAEAALFRKNLSWAHMRLGAEHFDRAEREALLARYEAINMQGYIAEARSRYDVARHYYQEALALAQQLDEKPAIAKTLNNLGRLSGYMEQYTEAIGYLQQAEKLFRGIGKRDSLASTMVNRALIYNLARSPQHVVSLASEALELFQQLGHPWGIAVAYQNLAEAYLELGQLLDAEQCARAVVDLQERSTLPDGLRVVGEARLAQGDSAGAEIYIRQSIDIAAQNKNTYLEAYGWRALARALSARGAIEEALATLDRALSLFAALSLNGELAQTRLLRSAIANERGRG